MRSFTLNHQNPRHVGTTDVIASLAVWCAVGSAGNHSPPVKPEVSVGGMLGVIDAMGAHSKADFVDYTGTPLEW